MHITGRALIALLALATLAGCASWNTPVNGLSAIPGGAYTPGSNMSPLSPGMFTGER